jgi:hypothetical protein
MFPSAARRVGLGQSNYRLFLPNLTIDGQKVSVLRPKPHCPNQGSTFASVSEVIRRNVIRKEK